MHFPASSTPPTSVKSSAEASSTLTGVYQHHQPLHQKFQLTSVLLSPPPEPE